MRSSASCQPRQRPFIYNISTLQPTRRRLVKKWSLSIRGTQANTVKYTRNITRFWKAIGRNLSFMTFSWSTVKPAILFIPFSKRQILPPTSLPARSAKQILPKRFIQQMRLKFPTASSLQILIIMNRLMGPLKPLLPVRFLMEGNG